MVTFNKPMYQQGTGYMNPWMIQGMNMNPYTMYQPYFQYPTMYQTPMYQPLMYAPWGREGEDFNEIEDTFEDAVYSDSDFDRRRPFYPYYPYYPYYPKYHHYPHYPHYYHGKYGHMGHPHR